MPDETNHDIAEINKKLDRIVRLLALSTVSQLTSMKEKAVQLSSVGLAPMEIAELLGTTPNSVSVMLAAVRRSKKKTTK